MGDQHSTVTAQVPDVIAIDPAYQSDATKDSEKKPKGFFVGIKKRGEETEKREDCGENDGEKKEEKKEEEVGMGNYIRILKYGSGLDFILQFIGSICAVAAGVTFPLMTVVFGELVTKFTAFFMPNSTVTIAEFRHSVDTMCLYFVYLFLGKFILGYIATVCFRLSGTRISAAVRLDYLTSIFRQDLAYFDALATAAAPKTTINISHASRQDTTPTAAAGTPGAVAVSITTLSNTVQMGISEKLALFIQFMAMLIGGFVVAFVKEWRLTLVTACILPATVLIYGVSVPIELKLERKVLAAQGKATELAEEVLGSIRTVKSFNAEKRLLGRYSALLEKGRKEGVKKAPNTGVQFAGAFTVIYCGYSVCFWYGIKLFESGKIAAVGTIITVFFAVLIAVMSFGNIAPQVQAMSKAASASSTIFEVIDRQPIIDATSSEGLKPPTIPPGDLELKNVKFSYPGERKDIVILGPTKDNADGTDDADLGISLSFPEGQTTAIVGRSGSGKSTIVGLIERWYDPQQGSVLIGGTDIRDLNLRWWRGKIGLVMQEPFLFNDSIYKNVAYGLLGTEWESEPEEHKRRRVKEACTEANANTFVEELPQGYDTKVGESGIKLSGGQKQRIAIARSIISKPPILILDEATSAIDPRNERVVQDALDRISKGRTTITIAHRLSTVKKADRIVVLGGGHVLETGTHEELLSRPDGAYTKLVQGQTLLMEDESQAISHEDLGKADVVEVEEDDDNTADNLRRTATWRSKLSIGKGKDSATADDIEAAHPKEDKQLGILRCISLMLWEQRGLWPLYLVGLFGSVGGGAAFPVQSILLAKFMTVFQYSDDKDEFVKRGNFWALMFFVLALAVGFFYFLMGSSFTLIQYRLTAHYRLEYFQNVLRQGIPFFDREGNSAGSLTSQLNTDPTALQNLLGTNTGMITVSFVNILGCSILSLVVGWKLGLVCIFAALPFIFFAGLVRVRIEVKFAADTAAVFAESAQFASEAVGAYRTVSSLIMEESIRERYKLLLRDQVNRSFRTTVFAAMIFSASESMNLLAAALCFWYGGRLMSTREYEPYQFFVVYMAIIQGGEAAGHFFGFTPDIAQALQAANRILGMREKTPPPLGEDMDHSGKGGYEVEFRNVDFSYPTRDTPVFHNLSLKIEKGQFAAFVGASGCGKTTTISLLERFYSVTGGEIFVNGKNLDSLEIESYRDVVSLVAQEPALYQGTVSENVRLGAKDENISHEEVVQACKEAHIHDFITSLPEGYDTICGARGVGLSGGQKQRVAIARALIRKPRILLLDEATASLDSESEKIVQQAFENAAQGRTMIAVAHRLSTVQKADVIFVFDEGRVVEQGSHAALIKKRGTYFQMCQAQALDH